MNLWISSVSVDMFCLLNYWNFGGFKSLDWYWRSAAHQSQTSWLLSLHWEVRCDSNRLALYVTWCFSFAAFNSLYLFCTFKVCLLSNPIFGVLYVSCTFTDVPFSRLGKCFSVFLLKIFSGLRAALINLYPLLLFLYLVFSLCPRFLGCFVSEVFVIIIVFHQCFLHLIYCIFRAWDSFFPSFSSW